MAASTTALASLVATAVACHGGTGLPVDVVTVPEGGAYGAAYLARVSAGLEPDASGAGRWASIDHRVEPDPAATDGCRSRYARFRDYSGI